MTMREYRDFVCMSGHIGKEITSENDQPYSDSWVKVRTEGLVHVESDGPRTYICQICRQPMVETH